MMQEYVHTRWLGGHAKLLVNPIETYATDPMACQLAHPFSASFNLPA